MRLLASLIKREDLDLLARFHFLRSLAIIIRQNYGGRGREKTLFFGARTHIIVNNLHEGFEPYVADKPK